MMRSPRFQIAPYQDMVAGLCHHSHFPDPQTSINDHIDAVAGMEGAGRKAHDFRIDTVLDNDLNEYAGAKDGLGICVLYSGVEVDAAGIGVDLACRTDDLGREM